MTKKSLLTWLLGMLCASFTPVFADAAFLEISESIQSITQCEAPAPDSFRVESQGSNFISLSWLPAWPGATHTLAVLIKDNSSAWNPLDTFYSVSGASYTISGLEFGAVYRFVIATNCSSGEPSINVSIAESEKVIVDLILSKTAPVDPVVVKCNTIDYASHNWVGFKVTKVVPFGTEPISNSFRVKIKKNDYYTEVDVARVSYNNPIVAANAIGEWPLSLNQSIPCGLPFKILKTTTGGIPLVIGYVNVVLNSNPFTVNICPDVQHPWDQGYSFSTITAENTEPRFAFEDDFNIETDSSTESVKVQNPFTETLHILLPKQYTSNNKISIKLFNIDGKEVLGENIKYEDLDVYVKTNLILPGIYILRIESEESFQNFRILKTN